jgi:hypothetical protein
MAVYPHQKLNPLQIANSTAVVINCSWVFLIEKCYHVLRHLIYVTIVCVILSILKCIKYPFYPFWSSSTLVSSYNKISIPKLSTNNILTSY